MKSVDVDAKYVILAASTLENTRLLLLSAKGGLANSSGTLGHYMMDQVGGGGVTGILPKLKGGPARLDDGKSAGITIPNFQNIERKTERKDFIRGYVMNATGGQTEYPQFAASAARLWLGVEEGSEEPLRRAGAHLERRRGDARAQGELRRTRSGSEGSLGHSGAARSTSRTATTTTSSSTISSSGPKNCFARPAGKRCPAPLRRRLSGRPGSPDTPAAAQVAGARRCDGSGRESAGAVRASPARGGRATRAGTAARRVAATRAARSTRQARRA